MGGYSVSKCFPWKANMSAKVAAVMRMFGVSSDKLALLSTAGLSDVFCILNEPAGLSDGQKWRFKLAMALASGREFVFADEFCSGLDRVTAAVISYNVHKFAKRNRVTFVLASSHEDTLMDLQPDTLIIKELSGPARVIRKNGQFGR